MDTNSTSEVYTSPQSVRSLRLEIDALTSMDRVLKYLTILDRSRGDVYKVLIFILSLAWWLNTMSLHVSNITFDVPLSGLLHINISRQYINIYIYIYIHHEHSPRRCIWRQGTLT